MNTIKKNILFSLVIFLLFFTFCELTFRIFSPPGAPSFIERRIIEEKITTKKAPNEIRIFLFGESTMHGSNLYPKSTIKKWMDLYLEQIIGKENARQVKVFNFGKPGANSTFIASGFAQTLPYKPDIVVFYSAHNDLHRNRIIHGGVPFSEKIDTFFSELTRKSCFISFFNRLHVYRRMLRHKKDDKKSKYSEGFRYVEIDRRISEREKQKVDEQSKAFQKLINNWTKNIQRIIRLGQKNNIPIIFFEGVANFKQFGPYESVHQKGMSAEQLRIWEALDKRADKLFTDGKYEQASKIYNECLNLDDKFAKTYYRLGQCYENLGYYKKANECYKLSNDYDHFPSRAHSFVNRFYEDVLVEDLNTIHIIKTQELFEQNAPHGIVDTTLTSDPVHPTIKGQSLMASAILGMIYEEKLLPADITWHWDKTPSSYLELYDRLEIDDEFLFFSYLNTAKYMSPRYHDAAIENVEKALSIDSDSLTAQRLLAWILWLKGEKEKALSKYKELYKKAPDTMEKVFIKYPQIKKQLIQEEKIN